MKSLTILFLLIALYPQQVTAQSVGIGTNNPKPSARLDVQSTTQGVTLPTMTSVQRKAISNPAKGLMVFDTDKSSFYFFDGHGWKALNGTAGRNVSPTFAAYPQALNQVDYYGWSMAMDNGFAVVGYPEKDSNAVNDAGAVYLFKKQAGYQWTLYQTLAAPDPEAGANFGGACAIDSNYLVIGAPSKDAGNINGAGKIYLYRLSGSSWVLETSLTMPVREYSTAAFGSSVAISHVGATVYAFVGSPEYKSVSNSGAGRVDIFRRNPLNGIWDAAASFTGNQLYLNLGYTIAAEGANVIVGAPGYDTVINNINYTNTGAAYTFQLNGSNWLRGKNLTGFINSNKYFGYRVAFRDSMAAISGINNGNNGETNSSNNILVYRLANNGIWTGGYSLSTMNLMETSACGGYSLAINKHFLLAVIPNNVFLGVNCANEYPRKLVVFKFDGNNYRYYKHEMLEIHRIALDGMDFAAPGAELKFYADKPNGIFFGNLEE